MRDIIYSAPLLEGSGYAEAARGYVYWLTQLTEMNIKLDFVYYTINNPLDYLSQDKIDYYTQYTHTIGLDSKKYKNSIYINHISPNIAYTRPNFGYNVLMSIWETDKLPEGSAEKCNKFDLIITASEYSKFAFLNAGVTKPIEVIPHIVTPYNSPISFNENLENLIKDKFVFLSVIEWHIGKGYDVLIRGFIEAFKGRDDVVLILKTNSFTDALSLKQNVANFVKHFKQDEKYPTIIPVCQAVSKESLMYLYSRANCYVSTSRREGFSLTLADAVVNEIPCIASDRGGHTEYLNDNNAILIPSYYSEIVEVERERSIYKGQRWIEMNYSIFLDALKTVADEWKNPDDTVKENFHKEVLKVREQLSPEINVNKLKKVLDF